MATISNALAAPSRNPVSVSVRGGGKKEIAGAALNLARVKIGAQLILGREGFGYAHIEGSLDLEGVRVEELFDDPRGWPPDNVPRYFNPNPRTNLPCHIMLDGLVYQHLIGPCGFRSRKRWLGRQYTFSRQPFDQLARVLHASGNEHEAKRVAIFKHDRALIADIAGIPWWKFWRWIPVLIQNFIIWFFYGLFAGYGYRPLRLLFSLLFFALCLGYVYSEAHQQGRFQLAGKAASQHVQQRPAAAQANQQGRPQPSDSPRVQQREFEPYFYSLDTLLPLLNLTQKGDWEPVSGAFTVQLGDATLELPSWTLKFLLAMENILGSMGALALAGIFSGLIRKDAGGSSSG